MNLGENKVSGNNDIELGNIELVLKNANNENKDEESDGKNKEAVKKQQEDDQSSHSSIAITPVASRIKSELSQALSKNDLNDFINKHFLLFETVEMDAGYQSTQRLKRFRTIFILSILAISAVGIFALSSIAIPQLIASMLGACISLITHAFMPYLSLKESNKKKPSLLASHNKAYGKAEALIKHNGNLLAAIEEFLNNNNQKLIKKAEFKKDYKCLGKEVVRNVDAVYASFKEIIKYTDEFVIIQSLNKNNKNAEINIEDNNDEDNKLDDNIRNILLTLQQQNRFNISGKKIEAKADNNQPPQKSKSYKATINFLYIQLVLCKIAFREVKELNDSAKHNYKYRYLLIAGILNVLSIICSAIASGYLKSCSIVIFKMTVPSFFFLSAIILTGLAALSFIIGNQRVNAASKTAKIRSEVNKLTDISNKITNINDLLNNEYSDSPHKPAIDRLKKRQLQNRAILEILRVPDHKENFKNLVDKLCEEKHTFINSELQTIHKEFTDKYPGRKLHDLMAKEIKAKNDAEITSCFTSRLEIIKKLAETKNEEKVKNPYGELETQIKNLKAPTKDKEDLLNSVKINKKNWLSPKKSYEKLQQQITQLQANYKKAISPELATFIENHRQKFIESENQAIDAINIAVKIAECNDNGIFKNDDDQSLKIALQNIEGRANKWKIDEKNKEAKNPYKDAKFVDAVETAKQDCIKEHASLHGGKKFNLLKRNLSAKQTKLVKAPQLSKNKYDHMLQIFMNKQVSVQHKRNVSFIPNPSSFNILQ